MNGLKGLKRRDDVTDDETNDLRACCDWLMWYFTQRKQNYR